MLFLKEIFLFNVLKYFYRLNISDEHNNGAYRGKGKGKGKNSHPNSRNIDILIIKQWSIKKKAEHLSCLSQLIKALFFIYSVSKKSYSLNTLFLTFFFGDDKVIDSKILQRTM